MIITTLGSPEMIASNPSSYRPLNLAFGPSISRIAKLRLTLISFDHVSSSTRLDCSSNSTASFVCPVTANGHRINPCHGVLTSRKIACSDCVLNAFPVDNMP